MPDLRSVPKAGGSLKHGSLHHGLKYRFAILIGILKRGGLGLGHNPEIRNSSRTLDAIESTQKCLRYRWQVVG